MKQAVIYCRVSSIDQVKGDGPDRQRRNGEQYVADQGWALVDFLNDEGKSAYHGKNREEGAALHQFELEARTGVHKGKVLCVENIDRLSRQGARAAAQLIWGFNENGVDVATWQDGTIYRSASGGDLLEIFGLILKAQMSYEESHKKAGRIADGWRTRHKRIEQGIQAGQSGKPSKIRPFWIDIEDDRYVLNEDAAKVVNQIFDWYIDGMGLDLMAKKLNEASVPSKAGYRQTERGWGKSKLYLILTRREAVGEYWTRKGEFLATGYFPPAVTMEKFNRAAQALAARKNSGGSEVKRGENILSGLIECADCGANGVYETQTNKFRAYVSRRTGEQILYARTPRKTLRCDHARRKLNCDNGTILKYDVVEDTVLQEMLPQLLNKGESDAKTRTLREDIAELARLKEANETRITTLVDLLADGGSKALMARMTALEAEVDAQQGRIEAMTKQLGILLAAPSELDDIALIDGLKADLDSEDIEVRQYARKRANMTLRRLIKRIIIHPTDTFTIEPDDFSRWTFDSAGKMLEGEWA